MVRLPGQAQEHQGQPVGGQAQPPDEVGGQQGPGLARGIVDRRGLPHAHQPLGVHRLRRMAPQGQEKKPGQPQQQQGRHLLAQPPLPGDLGGRRRLRRRRGLGLPGRGLFFRRLAFRSHGDQNVCLGKRAKGFFEIGPYPPYKKPQTQKAVGNPCYFGILLINAWIYHKLQ